MDFREYLEHFGWSQAFFSRRVGVSPDTVSRWKGEAPRLVMLYLEELYGREQDFKRIRQTLEDLREGW